jgi:hypothetical protein
LLSLLSRIPVEGFGLFGVQPQMQSDYRSPLAPMFA